MVEKGVLRFSVSVQPELLTDFDEIIKRMHYDRSKAIQLAMRNFLTEYTWKYSEEGMAAGTMTIIYDHEAKGLEKNLTDTQHLYMNTINSAMHIHLDEQNCLLVIAVNGKIKTIQNLAKDLMNKRGIKQLKLAIVTL
ncbi:MAG TPA: nickel-responsive transcriptional regulator NikR [archaeon]|nr:nickel-responsive transcriptional regulator NikR [archaeon]